MNERPGNESLVLSVATESSSSALVLDSPRGYEGDVNGSGVDGVEKLKNEPDWGGEEAPKRPPGTG